MALNFPNSPQPGDIYLNYTWDGDKWTLLNEAEYFQIFVAADDSTKIRINSGESVKFIGAGGITTASDSEGNITINAPVNITGNAETVTNGVYTTGSYINPNWITSLDYSKISSAPDLETQWGDYNVTWTAATTDPTIGSGGVVSGRYKKIGKTVFLQFKLTIGIEGYNGGEGEWRFSLPFAAKNSSSVILNAVANNIDTAFYQGLAVTEQSNNTSYVTVLFDGNLASATVPFTWGAGDTINITGVYESEL